MKGGPDLIGAAQIVPDTRCVFNFVSSDVNMGWKRSVVTGEGLRAWVSTISSIAPYKVLTSAAISVCLAAWWMKRTSLLT